MKLHTALRAAGSSLLLVGLTTLPAASDPLVLELDFDTLPSEQGWQLHASYQEAQIVALSEGLLSFDSTRGSGIIAGGYRLLALDVPPMPGNTVTFQARVVDEDPGAPGTGHGHFFLNVISPRGTESLFRIEDNSARIGTRFGMGPSDERSHTFDAANLFLSRSLSMWLMIPARPTGA